jgi:hypothetical protein
MLPTMPPAPAAIAAPVPAISGFGDSATINAVPLLIDSVASEQQAANDREAVVSSLASHIRRRWEDAKRAKQQIEPKLLEALRQRVGEYPPDKLTEIRKMGGSEVFVRLTDTKCAAASAWIRDVLSLDRPWALDPTTTPELSPEQSALIEQQAQQKAFEEVQQQLQLGLMLAAPDPAQIQAMMDTAAEAAKGEAQAAMDKEARDRIEKMSDAIQDYLDESKFKTVFAEALDWDLVTFGTAIIKAPVMRSRRRLEWQQQDGRWEPVEIEDTYPDVERVSPLDLYPSDDATSIQDASYLIERYTLSRSDLSACKGIENYNAKAIDAVLEAHGSGGLREWTSADSERARLAERSDDRQYGERIDALIYWGEVQGKLLTEWGIKAVQPLSEYAVEAWLIGSHVVRVDIKEPHELDRPYCKAVYRPRPGSFWGLGIPELMADVQQQANATARALANNMALASGPQVGIDMEQMPPGEDGSKVWPWKVWRFNTGKYGQSSTPPIAFFQPAMHANELMGIYQQWVRIADDVTGIPAYVYGGQETSGAGKTASGLSMLMGAATKAIKSVIANIDEGLIEPLVRQLFRHAMLYHPDETIKGDVRVVAKGASALLVREQAQVRRNEFLQITNNPTDLQIMGLARRADLLRSTAETLSLDPDQIAPTRSEYEQQEAAQQQQAAMLQQQQQQQSLPPAAIAPDGSPVSGQDTQLFPGGM